MQCRKRLQAGKDIRCKHKASVEGYCEEHWYLYQIGVEFHDPSQDFDFEDLELNELLQTLEKENFFQMQNEEVPRPRVDTDEIRWNRAATDLAILGEDHFAEIARSVNQLIPNRNFDHEIHRTDLEKFSKDKQNVHTTLLVKKTMEVSTNLINLSKDTVTSHDTLVSILQTCRLSNKAQDNMMEYYFSDISIYELPAPTFKLVLDGLWIYIQSQSKEDCNNLIERLKQELEDNTGTCAQGNLSRLVNTLNGFSHTVEEDIPIGDLMKKLTSEPNLKIRKQKAEAILKERNVKGEDAKAWIELIEST